MNDDGSYRLNPRNDPAPGGRKLVSAITGTWQRRDLLIECVENIRQQTYPNLEHVIVSDGPDPELQRVLFPYVVENIQRQDDGQPFVPIVFAECGRNWSSFLAKSESAVPFQVAQWLARGEYLAWWADDERATPDHVEALVDLLESTDSDFVYPQVDLWFKDQKTRGFTIGADPPTFGGITHCLYRADLLDYRGFTTHVGSGTDWDQVEAWIAAGAKWAMLPRVTFTHRVDKRGEGPGYRPDRRPLRGHRA